MLAVAPHPAYNLPVDFDHLIYPDDHIAMLTLGLAYETLPSQWEDFDSILLRAAEGFDLPNEHGRGPA
jgi:hypothetical protein